MKPLLAHIRPLDLVTGLRVDVYVGSSPTAAALGLGGIKWESAITRRPRFSLELFSPTLDGRVSAGRGDLQLSVRSIRQVPAPAALYWSGAPIVVYDATDLDLATAPIEFDGIVRQPGLDLDSDTLTLNLEVSTQKLQKPLLRSEFTGAGDEEGDAAKKGVLKPAGFGTVLNVEPVWFDEVRNIGMVDGYGNLLDVTWLGEGLSTLDGPVADYPNYAALAGAIDSKNVVPGQWATCIAEGMVGLGAPPAAKITCDCEFGADRPGTFARRVLEVHASIPVGDLDVASFDALTVAVNRPVHYWTANQRDCLDLVEAIAASCNATPVVSFQGQVAITRAFGGDVVGTLARNAPSSPRVLRWSTQDPDPPTWRFRARAARPGTVTDYSDVLYEDDLTPRGVWKVDEVYRQGHYVDQPNGARFLYVNAEPGAGHALPVDPATTNDYWTRIKPPTTAADLFYPDGTPIADLQPAEPGANVTETRTSLNTSNVASMPATAVVTNIGSLQSTQAAHAVTLADLTTDVDDLQATYGNTASSAANASAAQGYANTALAAQTAAETARNQAQSAQSAAETAQSDASAAANLATTRAGEAAGSATAAAGSASSASSSATDAGNSASAAQGYATNAASSAGVASTSAGQAATSATTASGSASSAATSATTAATARDTAVTQISNAILPRTFDEPTGLFWTSAWTNALGARPTFGAGPFVTASDGAKVFRSSNYAVLANRGALKIEPGRIYEGRVRIRQPAGPVAGVQQYNGIMYFDASGEYLGHDYSMNPGYGVQPTFQTFTSIVTYDQIKAARPLTEYINALALVNYLNADPAYTAEVEVLGVEDVTVRELAAASASAAATSASNAAASATTAGQQASAAQTSATNAATSAGNASTSAGQAATSATNAAGSASTAATQATNAANSASAAGGSATAAAGSASAASTSATNAGNSASAAQGYSLTAQSARDGSLAAAAKTFPSTFDQDGTFFTLAIQTYAAASRPAADAGTDGLAALSYVTVAGVGRVAQAAGYNVYLGQRGLYTLTPGRTYEASARVRDTGNTGTRFYMAWATFTAAGAYAGFFYTPIINVVTPAAWTTFTGTVTTEDVQASIPTAAYMGLAAFMNYNSSAGSNVQMAFLASADVTDRVAAAGSATAAATSASSAATSATNAGNSATSATNSANTASTHAGNASSSASAAAGSAASASTSAASASQSSTLTASIAGRTAPGDFSQDGAMHLFMATTMTTDNPGNWGVHTFPTVTGVGKVFQVVKELYTYVQTKAYLPIRSDHTYRVRGSARTTAGNSQPFYCGFIWFDASGIALTNVWSDAPTTVSGGPWQDVVGTMTGAQMLAYNANAAYVAAIALIGYPYYAVGNTQQMRLLQIEDITDLAKVQGDVGTLQATVSTQATAITTLQGRSAAYLTQTVQAGIGAAAFVELRAETSPGSVTSSVAIGAREFHVYNDGDGGFKRALSVSNGDTIIYGSLTTNAGIYLGTGTKWQFALRQKVMSVTDGTPVSYGANIGAADFVFQGDNLAPLSSGETYKLYADAQTGTGFTPRLRIVTPGTTSTITLNVDTTPGTGPTRQINKGANADSATGIYRLSFEVSLTANAFLQTNNPWDPRYAEAL